MPPGDLAIVDRGQAFAGQVHAVTCAGDRRLQDLEWHLDRIDGRGARRKRLQSVARPLGGQQHNVRTHQADPLGGHTHVSLCPENRDALAVRMWRPHLEFAVIERQESREVCADGGHGAAGSAAHPIGAGGAPGAAPALDEHSRWLGNLRYHAEARCDEGEALALDTSHQCSAIFARVLFTHRLFVPRYRLAPDKHPIVERYRFGAPSPPAAASFIEGLADFLRNQHPMPAIRTYDQSKRRQPRLDLGHRATMYDEATRPLAQPPTRH